MSAVDVVYQGLTIVRGASVRAEGERLFIEMNAPMPVATRVVVQDPEHRMEGRVIRVHEGVGAGMTIAPAGDEVLPGWVKALRPEPVPTVEIEAEPEPAEAPPAVMVAPAPQVEAPPPPPPAPQAPPPPLEEVKVAPAPAQVAPEALQPISRALPMEPTTLALKIPELDALPPPPEAPPAAAAAAAAPPAASAATPPPSAATPTVQAPPYEATLEMAIPSLDDEEAPREERRGGSKKPKKPARRR